MDIVAKSLTSTNLGADKGKFGVYEKGFVAMLRKRTRMFSNIGNPHKSLRSWDCNKVGLSILDSLDDDDIDGDDGKGFGKVLQSSESPFESEPFGKIRSCSLDSCRSSSSLSRLAGQKPESKFSECFARITYLP
ncbi:hypothetical protein OIU78_023532 [Salix suchowensis]|nr:hypothetical protein OIU78_023532 [Salix suchowensis]